MKSLDRHSLDEQTQLVSRYVAGDLSRSERAEFEAWLVASPELAVEVEMERRMRRGIASAARRGWLQRPALQRAPQDRYWRVGIAAALLTALAVGWSIYMPRGDQPQLAESRAPVERAPRLASRVVHLASNRGMSDAPDLEVSRIDAPG